MSYFYVNANQPGDIVELDERNPRLDQLDNWEAFNTREQAEEGARKRAGYTVHGGVLHRDGMVAAPTIAPRRDDDETAPPTTARKAAKAADRVDDADTGAHSAQSPRRR